METSLKTFAVKLRIFSLFDFNHVSRSCNCVGDALAKKSSKQAGASRVAARATCRHCSFTVI